MIDSNFTEIKGTPPSYELTQTSNITHRIYSELFKDNNANGEIYKLCLEKMIDAFDRDNFGPTFTKYDGVAPTEDFLKKLDIILRAATELLDKHVAISDFFDSLGETTLPDVAFNDFNFSFNEEDSEVSMIGEARGFLPIAQQSDLFEKNQYIKNHNFSDFQLTEKDIV